jgi:putative transposase
VSESYAFIAAENADPDCAWPLIKMCAWLDVSRSGFYEYLNREPSNTTRRRERLLVLVKAIFSRSPAARTVTGGSTPRCCGLVSRPALS